MATSSSSHKLSKGYHSIQRSNQNQISLSNGHSSLNNTSVHPQKLSLASIVLTDCGFLATIRLTDPLDDTLDRQYFSNIVPAPKLTMASSPEVREFSRRQPFTAIRPCFSSHAHRCAYRPVQPLNGRCPVACCQKATCCCWHT